MKTLSIKFILAITALLFSMPSSAKDLFPSLYDSPDIETVFVSKAMMMSSAESRSILFGRLSIYDSKDLDDLYVYSAKNPEGIALAEKTLKEFSDKNKNLEILMRTKSEKEESIIYGLPSDKPGHYTNVIIVSKGKGFSMVVLTGSINFNFTSGISSGQLNSLSSLRSLDSLDSLKSLKSLKSLERLKSLEKLKVIDFLIENEATLPDGRQDLSYNPA